ncbi:unnamed protein product [Danaus chrysippus]|uniref:(African queen) hypothetical protein n=1 Tax=Danaus chrysippus TaxID=151541 RepID=A0A8J2W835_9NEOP|nr:unnamed protein product [Danaus chrysippus]
MPGSVPPPPPPRSDSLRLSAEDMVLSANAGARTSTGALAHYLTAELLATRPQPRSALSLRVDSEPAPCIKLTASAHALPYIPILPPPPPPATRPAPLPLEPLPPPELFDF